MQGPAGAGRALHIAGVEHRYRSSAGDVLALGGIDLTIEPGAFVTVVGPSGCGKTTLLQLVAGLLRPTSGTVTLDGDPITGPGRDRGVVFQQPTSLYPWLSVRRNVELGLRLGGVRRAERSARALVELERVGLTEFADRRPYELSGGMQQRCQIARVLANDPDIILMDEPFGAVDALTREQLQEQIRGLWKSTRRTVILITHSVDEAVLLGSRVLVMSPRPGRIELDLPVGFAATDRSNSDLRADPEFTAAAHRVRDTITRP
ncbi:MAG TPA: ABC transporter ATP-binding protein [Ilumatobacter sp.]|nr:ABC transporter ATP-binding protein [Ilumatobacter sp.]